MAYEIRKNWEDFKSEVTARSLRPQFYSIGENGGATWNLFARDGYVIFVCNFSKSSEYAEDFVANYQSTWNQQLSFSDPSGIQQVIPSARPVGTTTFFSGEGDNGVELKFDMTANDASIVKELTFNEDIWIKDGGMQFTNAPFGAYFTVEAVHPQAGVVAKFCRKIFILGTGVHELNSEDKSLVPQGLILRITVFNAPTPAAFKAVGWLEGFRTTMT